MAYYVRPDSIRAWPARHTVPENRRTRHCGNASFGTSTRSSASTRKATANATALCAPLVHREVAQLEAASGSAGAGDREQRPHRDGDVESRERGGSLITARAAAERSVEVMAVPGSPRCRASAGTNQLLVDGAGPVTCVDDVMAMLGLDHRRQGELPFDPRPMPDALQSRVLAACQQRPSTIDMVFAEVDATLSSVALAAARLERDGWLVEAGGWFEATGSRLQP